jgi:RNA polymerase sigma factor (sigma-70 family)
MGASMEDAQDLTQETFIKVIKHMGKHDVRKSFSSWIYTIALNNLKDFRKLKKSFPN